MDDIAEKLKALPTSSGVYVMLDGDGGILYIGKAKNLRRRVSQYFGARQKDVKTTTLVERIRDFRYIVAESEYDALALENNLIKEHRPPYNVSLKDDKTYPHIRIDPRERFPKAEKVFKVRHDGARYFGPYMRRANAAELLRILRTVFPLRTCGKMPKKECLDYHIGRCAGPCIGKASEEEYREITNGAIEFLRGKTARAREALKEKMERAARAEEFESAKECRDALKILDEMPRRQPISFNRDLDIDVFSFAASDGRAAVNCFAVRRGIYLGGRNCLTGDLDYDNAVSSFVTQYYEINPVVCDEVALEKCGFRAALTEYLEKRAKRPIRVVVPASGMRKRLIDMGKANAEEFLRSEAKKAERREELTYGATVGLKEALGLKKTPERIECYDASHISGTYAVSAMVAFRRGAKDADMYRRFKIKDVGGNDDFASIGETLKRRFEEYAKGEDASFSQFPDLIIVDGGKGQLSAALRACRAAGAEPEIAAIAEREEELFVPGRPDPIRLKRTSAAFRLVTGIRDEAHRFALAYHRSLREKAALHEALTEIEGIGNTKARNLLLKFGDLEHVRKASKSELMATQSINSTDAENILRHFGKGNDGAEV